MSYTRLSAPRRLFFSLAFGLLWSAALLGGGAAHAQRPVGQWELIAPGTTALRLVEANNAVYVAGAYGLFKYDLTDNSVRVLSKQDGLAGVVVAALAYDETTGLIVIGYRDANIDLLDPRTNRIVNVADVERRTIVGAKSINNIATHDGQAFLACTFGIVVLDLRRFEIVDSYVGLDNGQNISIGSIAVSADSVVASRADGLGVLVGRRSRNLLDFANWTSFLAPVYQNALSIARFGARFYFAGSWKGLFRLGPTGAVGVPGVASTDLINTAVSVANNRLVVAHVQEPFFEVMQPNETITRLTPAGVGGVAQVLPATGGGYFIADYIKGLQVLDAAGTITATVAPNGPRYDISFATAPGEGADMWGLSGSYNQGTSGRGRRVGFAHRTGGRWITYERATVPNGNFPRNDNDLSAAAWNPANRKLYIASWGRGLIEWSGPDGPTRQFDPSNSPLQVVNLSTDPLDARVAGVAVDAAGVVWVTNYTDIPGRPGVFSFNPTTSQWTPYLQGVAGAERAEKIIIDDNGFKWISGFFSRAASTAYLIVLNSSTGRFRQLGSANGNGALAGSVYTMAKDRKGDVWVGTAKGVQVFYNTAGVFSTSSYNASFPIIDRRPLLDGVTAKVIAVDGANRKWIGTDDGLYLFNEDGDELIARYTADNSPLPSNAVNSLSINGTTGEIFVGTDNGLIALRGTATEPSTEPEPVCAKVFPNPVPARFSGQIAFDGLPGGATVKITDVAGQLVYETKANGSRAVWDARDYNGRRVRTGIYLAYASDPDGQNTCVSKVAVMGE